MTENLEYLFDNAGRGKKLIPAQEETKVMR
jgi:hypothetical protein